MTLSWERQPCDDELSWPEFVKYRDAPSPRRLIRPSSVSTRELHTWYQACNWGERVAAYDRHLDGIVRAEREAYLAQSAKEVAAHHMAILQGSRELLDRETAKLLQLSKDSEGFGVIKPAELIKLTELVVKMDRLVRGDTTENAGTTFDGSKLTLEEVLALEALAEKGGGK